MLQLLRRRFATRRAKQWGRVAFIVMVESVSTFAAQKDAATANTCPKLEAVTVGVGVRVDAPKGFDGLALYDTIANHQLKDLSLQLKNDTWTMQGDDLTFPAIPNTHREKIALGWTKHAEGEKSPLCLQPLNLPHNPVVNMVVCQGNKERCGLGDRIEVEIQDLDYWVMEHGVAQGKPGQQTIADLVPFFNNVPVRGVHPDNPATRPYEQVTTFFPIHRLRFTLERNTSNREEWNRLLNGLQWGRRVDVSVGFEGGDPMPTWVIRDDPSRSDPTAQYFRAFELQVLPKASTLMAALLFCVALVAFLWLAKATEILQDVSAPLRPDNRAPYSLARVQMAVWFFLVAAAWFLLFLVTNDLDTLTSSVLVLIGISAGTAVGSAIIDAGTTIDAAERIRNVPTDPKRLEDRAKELRDGLTRTRALIPTTDAKQEAKRVAVKQLAADLLLVESQKAFFGRRPWHRLMYDLLGDDGHISFHRFQVAVWTLVLALVFVIRVLSDLAMPEFSATILGLMGISSGTYLGFKLPAASATGGPAKN